MSFPKCSSQLNFFWLVLHTRSFTETYRVRVRLRNFSLSTTLTTIVVTILTIDMTFAGVDKFVVIFL